jgi:acyl transferase domain-containing protein
VIPGYELHGLPLSHKTILNGSSSNKGYTNGQVIENGHTSDMPDEGIHSVKWWQPAKLLQRERSGARSLILLPFSAHDDYALRSNVTAISNSINQFDIGDVLYTLGSRTSGFSRRAFAVTESKTPQAALDVNTMSLGKIPSSPAKRIGFIFTGQGAQWPEMGARLIDEYAVFRESIRYLDGVLARLRLKPTWTIEKALQEPLATSRIHDPDFSQTVCTALQIALVNLLKEWGIRPVAAVGHSSGKYTILH